MLETVGAGADAELVDGAGAGAELGGVSVGAADELREPGPLGGPDERGPLPGLEAPGPPEDVAGWPGRAEGCPWAAAIGASLRCRWPAVGAGVPVDDAAADGSVPLAETDWLAGGAGAVRANRVAKPTAVTALSCVTRQVSWDRRRSPAERATPRCSCTGTGTVGGSYE